MNEEKLIRELRRKAVPSPMRIEFTEIAVMLDCDDERLDIHPQITLPGGVVPHVGSKVTVRMGLICTITFRITGEPVDYVWHYPDGFSVSHATVWVPAVIEEYEAVG
jgi:hypothetical protein